MNTKNNCKNCKWFEKGNFINFCNSGFFIVLPKGLYNKCPDWKVKKKIIL